MRKLLYRLLRGRSAGNLVEGQLCGAWHADRYVKCVRFNLFK